MVKLGFKKLRNLGNIKELAGKQLKCHHCKVKFYTDDHPQSFSIKVSQNETQEYCGKCISECTVNPL